VAKGGQREVREKSCGELPLQGSRTLCEERSGKQTCQKVPLTLVWGRRSGRIENLKNKKYGKRTSCALGEPGKGRPRSRSSTDAQEMERGKC